MTMSVPAGRTRVEAAGGVGQQDRPRTEATHEQHRLDHQARIVALVEVEPALEQDDRHARQLAEEQPTGMAGGGRGRPAGQVGERDGDGAVEVVRQAAEPRAEDDADVGHEVRTGADGGDQGGEAGRLVGGRIGSRIGRAWLTVRTQDRGLAGPDGGIDTGMPITSLPAGPRGRLREGAPAAGNEAPEATGGGDIRRRAWALMRSQPPCAPSRGAPRSLAVLAPGIAPRCR